MKAKKLSKNCLKDLNKRLLRGQSCKNCMAKYLYTPNCFKERKGNSKKNICPHWIKSRFK